MKYRAVIFDLDGVLCHTDQNHYKAWKMVADEIGVPFDERMNDRLRGVSRNECLEILLENHQPALTDPEKKEYTDKKNEYYIQSLGEMSAKDLAPDVEETLRVMKGKGILMAIGSSSRNANYILMRLGLDGFFDAVSDGNGIKKAKPDPEVFQRAAELLGVAPEECLVVEDAKAGIEAALAAKMDCAAIGDGVRYELALYNLDELSDILAILELDNGNRKKTPLGIRKKNI